jgi:small subunit ribosomal protein S17
MAIIWNKSIKELVWEVVSDKNNKTRIILVKSVKVHPLYKKRFIVKKKFYVHDEKNESKIWDKIKVRETKPISKTKRWKLIEVM